MKLLVAEAIKEFARFIQPSLLFAVFELLGNTRFVRITRTPEYYILRFEIGPSLLYQV